MLRQFYLYCLIFFIASGLHAGAQTISTIAGNGFFGYAGDGSLATNAKIKQPMALAIDSAGNVFIGDGANVRVRKVNTSGIISTWAGNGVGGSGGWAAPTVPATSGAIGDAAGLVLDENENLYICAGGDVLKVTPGQMMSWAGGVPVATGYSGDGAPFASTTAGIAAAGIAMDRAGNLYIADRNNKRVRKVDTLSGAFGNINTIAGTGIAGSTGDGGAATNAQLNLPYDVCVDKFGNVYTTDYSNNKIRRITPSGIITTYAGTGTAGYTGDGGPATSAQLNSPIGIDCDTFGNIFFSDSHNNVIRKISSSGIISTIAGTGVAGFGGDGGPATAAVMNDPYALALDRYGNVYFTDGQNFRIRKITFCTPPATPTISGASVVCAPGNINLAPSATGGTWYASNGHASVSGGTVTGVSAGVDTIYYVYTTCAAVVTSKVVTVNASPAAITGTNVLCSGASTTLSDATTGGSWAISPATAGSILSTGVVFGGMAGTGTVSYTLTSGCAGTALITVNPLPAAITGTPELCAGATFTVSTTSTGGTWTSADPSVATVSATGGIAGVTAGTALISYTIAGGCSRTIIATVDPLPAAITGTTLLCAGATTILSDASAGGTWSSGNTSVATVFAGSVTGVAAGTANITYVLFSGCKATTIVTVDLSPDPITGVTDICKGETITLTDATGGGTWSSGSAAVSVDAATGAVTGLTNGIVTIAYSLADGCTATVGLNVEECLGVAMLTASKPLIYPNPAYTVLTIEAQFNINTVEVYDVTGRRLYAADNGTKKMDIPVFDLQPGLYMLTINGEHGRWFVKATD